MADETFVSGMNINALKTAFKTSNKLAREMVNKLFEGEANETIEAKQQLKLLNENEFV